MWFLADSAHLGSWQLFQIAGPVAWRWPFQVHGRLSHTIGDAVYSWFDRNMLGGQIVVIITPITLRQPSADMANCIAYSPLIRSLALHPNTLGYAPYVQFGWNRLWVRVIVGYLPKQIKSIFLHTTINWAVADCFACGAATPNLRAGASSKHFGRLPLMLVWSESIVGASN